MAGSREGGREGERVELLGACFDLRKKEGVYPQKAKLWLSYSTLKYYGPTHSQTVTHLHTHLFTHIQTGCYHLGMCAHPDLCLPLHSDVRLLYMCLLLLLFRREKEEVESTQDRMWGTYINNGRLLPVSAVILSINTHTFRCM